MKDLILIGAHCPDAEREQLLYECVNTLQTCRKDYDILITSHTEIPSYITNKVDYTFYDRNNELITDLDYLNQPWFSPTPDMTILSTYVGEYSTYLAVYRLLIFGLGFAKMYGYQKVHYVEYDTIMNDLSELYDNSKLLDTYDNVMIQKEQRDFELNLAWPIGNFMSFKVDKIDEVFTNYNKEKLLEILKESSSKTNEKITYDIIRRNNNTVYVKDFDEVIKKDIKFALSNNTSKESMNYWTVPFYHTQEGLIYLIVWNNKGEGPIDVSFIINDNQLKSFKGVNNYEWRMDSVGSIDDINTITILVNNKIKTSIDFKDIKQSFIKTNYSIHT